MVREEGLRAAPDTPVEAVMDPGPSTYRPNVSIEEMARHLEQHRRLGACWSALLMASCSDCCAARTWPASCINIDQEDNHERSR